MFLIHINSIVNVYFQPLLEENGDSILVMKSTFESCEQKPVHVQFDELFKPVNEIHQNHMSCKEYILLWLASYFRTYVFKEGFRIQHPYKTIIKIKAYFYRGIGIQPPVETLLTK